MDNRPGLLPYLGQTSTDNVDTNFQGLLPYVGHTSTDIKGNNRPGLLFLKVTLLQISSIFYKAYNANNFLFLLLFCSAFCRSCFEVLVTWEWLSCFVILFLILRLYMFVWFQQSVWTKPHVSNISSANPPAAHTFFCFFFFKFPIICQFLALSFSLPPSPLFFFVCLHVCACACANACCTICVRVFVREREREREREKEK